MNASPSPAPDLKNGTENPAAPAALPKICKNCKYWGEFPYSRECSMPFDGDDNSAQLEVYTEEGEGGSAGLLTGPNFGCIKFSPRR